MWKRWILMGTEPDFGSLHKIRKLHKIKHSLLVEWNWRAATCANLRGNPLNNIRDMITLKYVIWNTY